MYIILQTFLKKVLSKWKRAHQIDILKMKKIVTYFGISLGNTLVAYIQSTREVCGESYQLALLFISVAIACLVHTCYFYFMVK